MLSEAVLSVSNCFIDSNGYIDYDKWVKFRGTLPSQQGNLRFDIEFYEPDPNTNFSNVFYYRCDEWFISHGVFGPFLAGDNIWLRGRNFYRCLIEHGDVVGQRVAIYSDFSNIAPEPFEKRMRIDRLHAFGGNRLLWGKKRQQAYLKFGAVDEPGRFYPCTWIEYLHDWTELHAAKRLGYPLSECPIRSGGFEAIDIMLKEEFGAYINASGCCINSGNIYVMIEYIFGGDGLCGVLKHSDKSRDSVVVNFGEPWVCDRIRKFIGSE